MTQQPDTETVRKLARMVAGRALNDVMNVADLSERFPDPDLRRAVEIEVIRIADRLIRTGNHPAPAEARTGDDRCPGFCIPCITDESHHPAP